MDLNQINNNINSNGQKPKGNKMKMFLLLMIPTIIFGFVAYLVYSNMVNVFNYAEATAEVVLSQDNTRAFKGNGKIPDLVIVEVQDLELQIITEKAGKVKIPLLGLDRDTYKVSDKVPIYYNSFNFSDAILKTDSLFGTSIMFLFPLFFCLLFGFFGLMILLKG